MTQRFANLTPAQQRVFEQIATNNDTGHPPATLAALERKGFVTKIVQHEPFGHLVLHIDRYIVPVSVHMEWCKWCAEQPDEEE